MNFYLYKYKFFLILTICQSILISSTYSISGIILDTDTQAPINNVQIFIDQGLGTITDNDGYFNLSIENYAIENEYNSDGIVLSNIE